MHSLRRTAGIPEAVDYPFTGATVWVNRAGILAAIVLLSCLGVLRAERAAFYSALGLPAIWALGEVYIARYRHKRRRVYREGTICPATVVGKRGRPGRSRVCSLVARYSVEGVAYTERASVPPETAMRYAPGDPIEIRLLPADPRFWIPAEFE